MEQNRRLKLKKSGSHRLVHRLDTKRRTTKSTWCPERMIMGILTAQARVTEFKFANLDIENALLSEDQKS